MIVYLANKTQFREAILSNRIEEIVHESLKKELGKSVGASELASWKHSLRHMDAVLEDPGIPHDAGVAIEFNIPQTGKRVDFIVTGTRDDGQRTAVIVELKQWQEAKATTKDAIVSTFVGGREREVSHPSYQAWSYAMLIEDFNETVRLDPIHLRPCAYLHNCASGSVIHAPFYAEHTKLAPAFLRDDAKELREFIKTHVKYGDDGETMYRIRDGRIRPSKGLADHLASLIQGNREFYLIDEQKVVYETALHLATSSTPKNKNVLLVNGGPGTGKTVVAINLLVELTNRELVSQYVTKNSAPRAVYENKLTGTLKKSRISNLFVGSGAFTETPSNTFQGLIVDEAHRLNEKSGLFSNLGENQIKELIYQRNRLNNRARMVAGYCWDWLSRKTKSNPVPKDYDIKLDGGDFKTKWNLSEDGSLWIVKPDSVREVGCIHTCQGLELDYVGVIIGPDLVVRNGKVVTDAAKRSGGDSSIKGYKGLLKIDSAAARGKADLIIKNTYRTLMTRGTKGCYVYSTDPETNLYLQTQGAGALLPQFEEPEIQETPPAYPFPILSPEEAADCPNAVPIFDIKIAAGHFSKEQWLQDCQYAELPDHFTAKPGFFLAQVVGESMNRRIPNGSWCLFREPSDGSRNGKVVIVQCRDLQDPDTGGQYTVKIYRSEKAETEDSWSHRSIRLEPDSSDTSFQPLRLEADGSAGLKVIGEFITIAG